MLSHFPTLSPLGTWRLGSTGDVEKKVRGVPRQIYCAMQAIALIYIWNEVLVDSSSWSNVTYVSIPFAAGIKLIHTGW